MAVAALPEQLAAVVAFVAFVAFVAVAALPVTLIPQVPEAPVPVGEGMSEPIARPKLVRAFAAVVEPVPPLATATVPVTFAAVPVVFWFNVGNEQLAKLPD